MVYFTSNYRLSYSVRGLKSISSNRARCTAAIKRTIKVRENVHSFETSIMKILWALAALISGVLLYNVVIYATGYLAAIPIPKEYSSWFGKPHVILAFAIFDLFVISLPKFLIALIWSVCTLLVFRKHYWLMSTFCFVGCVMTQVYWDYQSNFAFNYFVFITGEPWAIPNLISVPCGIFAASFFVFKFRHVDRPMR